MKTIYLVLTAGLLLTLSSKLMAQDEFEEVKVLDHPRYSLTHRFNLDMDGVFLPIDAYYKPIMMEAAISYQPTDSFSWEIARVGYALTNHNTGLRDSINSLLAQNARAGATPAQVNDSGLKLADMRTHISSTGFLNLLYSKSNFFNTGIAYYYWQLGLGFSYYDMKNASQMGADIAVRVRFFLNEHFNINIRGGQSIGFKDNAPKHITFLGLGAGFAL